MTYAEFVKLVAECRGLQHRYFRLMPEHRPPGLLERARKLEKAVDEALERVQSGQMSLFPRELEEETR